MLEMSSSTRFFGRYSLSMVEDCETYFSFLTTRTQNSHHIVKNLCSDMWRVTH